MPRLNAFTNRILVGKGLRRRVSVTITLSSNTTDYTLDTAQIPGYVAGITDVTLVVNSGVYVYSTNTANAGLTIAALNIADTVTIVNDGYIIGMGGTGAGCTGSPGVGVPATNGGPALTINHAVSITNNSYIAGGGGGGGTRFNAFDNELTTGGGGAGGGAGGTINLTYGSSARNAGGAGGGPGQTGSNGAPDDVYGTSACTGGGGGRILPGTGGAGGNSSGSGGAGGGAGGGGGSSFYDVIVGGGGGGGWGASGGEGAWNTNGGGAGGSANNVGVTKTGTTTNRVAPGVGGKAVNLNGFTATWIATGTRWGAIS